MKKSLYLLLVISFVQQICLAESVEEAIERAKKDGSAERAANTNCETLKHNLRIPGACLSDDEMRESGGPIIAPGIFTPEVERELIEAIKNNDQASLATVQLVNQSSIAAKTGQLNNQLVQKNLDQYLAQLINSGIPKSVIEAQLQQAFLRQNQLIHENQLNQLRQEIMNQFLQSIDSQNQSFSLAAFYIAFFQFPMNDRIIIRSQFGQIEFVLRN